MGLVCLFQRTQQKVTSCGRCMSKMSICRCAGIPAPQHFSGKAFLSWPSQGNVAPKIWNPDFGRDWRSGAVPQHPALFPWDYKEIFIYCPLPSLGHREAEMDLTCAYKLRKLTNNDWVLCSNSMPKKRFPQFSVGIILNFFPALGDTNWLMPRSLMQWALVVLWVCLKGELQVCRGWQHRMCSA